MRNLAITPAMNPMMMVQRMPMPTRSSSARQRPPVIRVAPSHARDLAQANVVSNQFPSQAQDTRRNASPHSRSSR
jgi:hypothetical protein